MPKNILIQSLKDSITLKQELFSNQEFQNNFQVIAEVCIHAFKSKNSVWFCGNGGSAADAQHLAAELSGRFYFDRPALSSEALHVNTSYLTAVANDYGYEETYARLIDGLGRENDVLIGLSTSGNSSNIINALKRAKSNNIITIGMTGKTGGKMEGVTDHIIKIPSTDTPRIQEIHMLVGHALCQAIEENLFKKTFMTG